MVWPWSLYDVIVRWSDMTWPGQLFQQKLRKGCLIGYWRCTHRFFDSFEKPEGVHPPSLDPSISLRPDGGCWDPLRFSSLPENGGCSTAVFLHTLSYIFSEYVVEISDPQVQVTRSHQATSPHKKLERSSKLYQLNDFLETFGDWYK